MAIGHRGGDQSYPHLRVAGAWDADVESTPIAVSRGDL
jgi:hypothetical protein